MSKPIRHRKVIRDSISRITKPAIGRILFRAGVKRISGLVYEEIRGILRWHLERLIHDVILVTEYNRRKTVEISDLQIALEMKGIAMAAALNENAKQTAALRSSNARGLASGGSSTSAGTSTSESTEVKKPHRFHPGVVRKREIRKQQKNSSCLAFPKSNFESLIREIFQDFVDNPIRLEKGVADLMQLASETYLYNILSQANKVAIHAKRVTLLPKDIRLVRSILSEDC